jgi:putative ATP-binding cassette transporter
MSGIRASIRQIWRLAVPYFRSEEKWPGLALLLVIVTGSLVSVAIAVRLSEWNRDFFNALQVYDSKSYWEQLRVFLIIVVAQVGMGMVLIYSIQLLEIRWRRWMTRDYIEGWLEKGAHYRLQVGRQGIDNPDQRIAMDIPLFIQRTLHMTVGDRSLGPMATGLLTAVATLFSFAVILWNLSEIIPFMWFGQRLIIPGYLLWAALIYAIVSTVFTHFVGRELIGLRFHQQRYEADFRYDLVRVRENSEQIALLRGEPVEERRLMGRFRLVADNWHRLMMRQVKLSAVTGSMVAVSSVLPAVLVAPAFFARIVGFGELMQISVAFVSVQGALSFFVSNYPLVAEWKAICDRLSGFESAVSEAGHQGRAPSMVRNEGGETLQMGQTRISLPNGELLIESDAFTLQAGDSVLVTGPTGSGKSTTFRVIGGIWPFAHGELRLPAGATTMVLPQRPYLPHGSLAEALAFPHPADRWSTEAFRAALRDVGLDKFVDRVDQPGQWDASMSGGEQQRVAIARALLHQPDYLFLDEATASLDEASESELYRLLRERMPRTAIMSIGHRSTLRAFHDRRIVVAREGEQVFMREH